MIVKELPVLLAQRELSVRKVQQAHKEKLERLELRVQLVHKVQRVRRAQWDHREKLELRVLPAPQVPRVQSERPVHRDHQVHKVQLVHQERMALIAGTQIVMD